MSRTLPPTTSGFGSLRDGERHRRSAGAHTRSTHIQNRDHVDAFWIPASSTANATVFPATGVLVDIPRAIHEPLVVVAALAAIVVSRAAIALAAGRKRQTRLAVFLSPGCAMRFRSRSRCRPICSTV